MPSDTAPRSLGEVIVHHVRALCAVGGNLSEDEGTDYAAWIDRQVDAELAHRAQAAGAPVARREVADAVRLPSGHSWPEEVPN